MQSTNNIEAGFAFVGSTLPASLIYKQIKSGQIATIYASDPIFLEPYKHLIDQSKIHVNLSSLSVKKVLSNGYEIIKILNSAKTKEIPVFIYHECCWPMLDICIWIVRPNVVYQPQANIEFMFKPVSNLIFFFRELSIFSAIKKVIFSLFFKYHYVTNDKKNGLLIVPRIRCYPNSVIVSCNSELHSTSQNVQNHTSLELLILSGTDAASTEELREVYTAVMNKAVMLGYRVSIKEHPNPDCRLNMQFEGAGIINPIIPIELIDDTFTLVVSTASAAMARYGNRSTSIIELLQSMKNDDKQQRIQYIQSLNPMVRCAEDIDSVFKFSM
jgi:hypothetical protein